MRMFQLTRAIAFVGLLVPGMMSTAIAQGGPAWQGAHLFSQADGRLAAVLLGADGAAF